MTLLPAYGRKYTTAEEMLADWNRGKDFHIYQGPYCSIRDYEILKREAEGNRIFLCYGLLSVEIK